MEKLEIKHLAPYLPYGVKVEIHKQTVQYPILTTGVLDIWNTGWYESMKPILRPLSDLTFEDIDNLGNRYEIQVECGKGYIFRDLDENINPLEWRYDDMQYFMYRHFDVFGLIEKGLAIDINTLNK